MPSYKIALGSEATITILGVDLTYMKGRHTVDADTLNMLRGTGATVNVQEIVPENAAMTSPFGGFKKNGYSVASAMD